MGKREVKSITLIILITLSVWQTSKLWLGNMSSLSFFASSQKSVLKKIGPESIWLVPGAPGTFVYRLGEENREYYSVRDEIEKNIGEHLKAGKIKEVTELNWEEMFQKKGILYQYPIPITYGEMIGVSTEPTPKDKTEINNIDYVFVQLMDDYSGMARWQLVSTENNKTISIEIQGQFENMRAFNDLLSEDAVSYKVKYQPTFNMVGVSNKNLFLPISSKEIPIPYEVLEWYNPLDNNEEVSRFNPYVNHYFLNPLLKKEEVTNGGIYIFSELMRAVVKYYPSGVFEYSNIAVKGSKTKIPRLEAYKVARRFLDENESLTKDIRNTLFLSNVEETNTGYIFSFDIRIGGIPVCFSEKERERTGMDNMAQVTVEGREISKFKWNASELKPITTGVGDKSKMGSFSMKYTDAINKVLEHVASKQELSNLVIDDMKWVYVVNGKEQNVNVRWIVLHDDEWYSP